MKNLRLLFILLTQLSIFPATTQAQQIQILSVLGPRPIIAGQQLQCNGAISYVANIGDIALARPNALFFRSDFFNLPPFVQWFIYAHECAHQVVGSNEDAADCWAIRLGRNQGFFPPQAINQICSFVFPTPGDWTHRPGPARCQQMQMCYAAP